MVRLMQAHLGASTEIFFLMGMDSLRDLLTWHEAEWLVENCRLAALSRPDVKVRWDALEARLPNIRQRVQLLDMPKLEIASHLLQERVRSGRPIRHQVPRSVELYIQEHDLYQNVAVNL
jgi:nicotinate-nucleotide adenylyltransferase